MRTAITINLNTGTIDIQTDDNPVRPVLRGPDKKPRKRRKNANKAVRVDTATAMKETKTE